jgi:hypothetical protein
MASVVTMQNAQLDAGTGQLMLTYSDGYSIIYNSLDDAKADFAALDSGSSGQYTARLLLAAWWLARQPDADNPGLVNGKSLTFDLGASQPIKVQ